jgi:hypothetical protein
MNVLSSLLDMKTYFADENYELPTPVNLESLWSHLEGHPYHSLDRAPYYLAPALVTNLPLF